MAFQQTGSEENQENKLHNLELRKVQDRRKTEMLDNDYIVNILSTLHSNL